MACRYAFIHEADILIYIRLLVTGSSGCVACRARSTFGRVLWVWVSVLLWPQLQTGRPEKKKGREKKTPSCLVVSYASGFLIPPVFSSDWLTHFHTQTVGHSPRAKGKCGWKVEGRPVALCHSSSGEVSAGLSQRWVIHNLLAASEEFVVVGRDLCRFCFHTGLNFDCDGNTTAWKLLMTMFQKFTFSSVCFFFFYSQKCPSFALKSPLKSHCDPLHHDDSPDSRRAWEIHKTLLRCKTIFC